MYGSLRKFKFCQKLVLESNEGITDKSMAVNIAKNLAVELNVPFMGYGE